MTDRGVDVITHAPLWAGLLLAAAVLVLVGLPVQPRSITQRPPRDRDLSRLLLVTAPLLWLWAGPLAAVLGLAGSWSVGRAVRRKRRERSEARERLGAGEALAVLAAELRAGRPPAAALAAASDVAEGAFARALRSAAGSDVVGADPVACLSRGASASAVPELLRGLAACWQVCASTGSSLAAAVDRLAESLRADQIQQLAVEAELAGPRATAGLLAVLPLAGVALSAGLGAHPLQVLLHTPVGWACLAAGIGLDALGVWWTGRLVAAARRLR